jgi:hypothetical protein
MLPALPAVMLPVLLLAASGEPAPRSQVPPAGFTYLGKSYPLHPATLDACPDLPSPLTTKEGLEVILGYREGAKTCTLIPVTVENGEPLNWAARQFGKGRQLEVDGEDFPTLARTGLHSDAELQRTRTITGRPVAAISEEGRPGRSSSVGFLAQEEDILGVLLGDNRLVRKLGLTHPELAKPMFQLWNLVHEHDLETRRVGRPLPPIDWFYYRGRKIRVLESESGKGWQESIFGDGILGMFQIRIRRSLDAEEEAFLRERYAGLDAAEMEELIHKLTHIRTGEMVPFYIMRYGFYEGHTSYRGDPIAIALVFGLKSLEEIEGAFPGKLFRTLNEPFPASEIGSR